MAEIRHRAMGDGARRRNASSGTNQALSVAQPPVLTNAAPLSRGRVLSNLSARLGLVTYRDRLGRNWHLQLFRHRLDGVRYVRFSLSIVRGKWGWAGSLWINRKCYWLRPIDYAAIARLSPIHGGSDVN